ncbi:MAG: S8 family serine peptidase [candidate division Zixibacteria bacterium]|nr:S8 family serine peptidase [candidate division Zixibacteria bacterium]
MTRHLVAFSITLTFFIAILSFSTPITHAISKSGNLLPQAVVRPRANQIIQQAAYDYLYQRYTDTARVWVFFADKGIFTKGEFDAKAATVVLSERALKRRAKVGKDMVVFADLPVVQEYVDQIIDYGGSLRHKSKWLNAASFDIPFDKLDEISTLTHVVEIRPVAGYKHEPVEIGQMRLEDTGNQSLSPDVLDYGNAQDQLEQINVPFAHDQGFDGSGVTLAILDTGFRKSHEAFATHFAEGRVLAEWDFVFGDSNTANEPEDNSSQWNHGTYIWSVSGGLKDGSIYGPAYGANFILCKTEDIRSETPVEEDNWVAAFEWVDSLGTDVITTSLGYSGWYTYEDMDGLTAVTSAAASTAAGLGIVVCVSAGNSGSGSGTITAPADAFDILCVGNVNSAGAIASSSSRGPTYDGRIKPEVCALGTNTFCASPSSDNNYQTASGTSLSTPLVAGAACLLIQARPNFSPTVIRQAIIESADNADNPDNNYGWGVMNLQGALGWGANFSADVSISEAPETVNFTDESTLSTPTWSWSFGDGGSSTAQNPTHYYSDPGIYDISLTIDTEYGPITRDKTAFIILLGDTITFETDSVFAGQSAVMSVNLRNSQPLNKILIPFTYDSEDLLSMDSLTLGERTMDFNEIQFISSDPWLYQYTVELTADPGSSTPYLPAGSGEVMKIYFSTDAYALGGETGFVDSTYGYHHLTLYSPYMDYEPQRFIPASISMINVLRGDANHSLSINVSDITYLVSFLFMEGPSPVSIQAGDANSNLEINVSDLTFLVAYLFQGGPPPANP